MLKFAFCVYIFATYVGAEIFKEPPTEPLTEPPTEPPTEPSTEKPTLDPSSFTFAIFKDKIPVCAGTVVEINSKIIYIATAAHCVYKVQNSRLSVSQGSAIFELKTVKLVNQVIVHPYYIPPSLDYNIALLKIKLSPKNIYENLASLSALTLSKVEPDSNHLLSVLSWNFKTANNSLQLSNATAENRKSCRAKLGDLVTLSSKTLCAIVRTDVVPDGGPLTFNDRLVGIASYKVKNRNESLPAVFTNIANSEIYSFIEKYI